MKTRTLLAAAAVAVLLAPGAGRANQWDSPACKADFQRLCPGVEPGEGRLVQCIANHLDELSLECRAQARQGHQGMHAGATAPSGTCLEDAKKHCAHVPHGSGGLFDCLKDKYLVLAPGCQMLVQNMIQRMDEMKAVCKDEVAKFCADGDKPMVPCLASHVTELGEACRANLKRGAGPAASGGAPHGGSPHAMPPAARPSGEGAQTAPAGK